MAAPCAYYLPPEVFWGLLEVKNNHFQFSGQKPEVTVFGLQNVREAVCGLVAWEAMVGITKGRRGAILPTLPVWHLGENAHSVFPRCWSAWRPDKELQRPYVPEALSSLMFDTPAFVHVQSLHPFTNCWIYQCKPMIGLGCLRVKAQNVVRHSILQPQKPPLALWINRIWATCLCGSKTNVIEFSEASQVCLLNMIYTKYDKCSTSSEALQAQQNVWTCNSLDLCIFFMFMYSWVKVSCKNV